MERKVYAFADWQSGVPIPTWWDVSNATDNGWSVAQIDAVMRSPEHDRKSRDRAMPIQNVPEAQSPLAHVKAVVRAKPSATATVTSISRSKEDYNPDEAWRSRLMFKKDGTTPRANSPTNWCVCLEHHQEMNRALAFDNFTKNVILRQRPAWEIGSGAWAERVLNESDCMGAVAWLKGLGMAPKLSAIKGLIRCVARDNPYDELRDYLGGLEWDGVPRVDGFFRTYFGVTDNPQYAEDVSRIYLISAAARGLRPGCKVDTMPIIEGGQGADITAGLRTLHGPRFYTDEIHNLNLKKDLMRLQGIWAFTITELDLFTPTNVEVVRKCVYRSRDFLPQSNGFGPIEARRRLVFAGTATTGGGNLLNDRSRPQRFLPVKSTKIEIDAIARDRDQIWAEAVFRVHANEQWVLREDEFLEVEAEEQDRRDMKLRPDDAGSPHSERHHSDILRLNNRIDRLARSEALNHHECALISSCAAS